MAQIQQEKDRLDLAPKKFVMWLIVFSSFMIFAALTSGFIVYSGGKDHALNMVLPKVFLYSTLTILFSSVTMFLAARAAKQLEHDKQRILLIITIVLGIVFFVLQVNGWQQMIAGGHYFVNNNATISFVYVFTGIHLLHIVAGILILVNALVKSYRNTLQVKNLYYMDLSSIFWHFIDIIWIYLYVFLILNQK
ncbi:MAG: heme-copper oxidase subunit III [Sphingobacteriaceae bacterium]|nr:MAG: heme-copper oxidase subunit III [Sphingobacteriaceae bacterium]